jgi:hypothetical protein
VLHPRLSGLWWGSLLLHDFMTAEGRFPIHPFCLCLSCRVLSRTGVSSFVELAYLILEDCLANYLRSIQHVVVRYFLNGLSAI